MSDLLTPEERSALQEPFADAVREARLVTPALFPSVDELDAGRVTALSGALRRWLEGVAEALCGQLRAPCTARPPVYQLVARSLLPGPDEEPFWAALDRYPGGELLVTLPRPFAAAITERLLGAPMELRDERGLTPGETDLLRALIRSWFNGAREPWHGLSVQLLPPAEDGEFEREPDDRTWLRFDSDLYCGAVTGSVSVCLAPFTARVLLGEATNRTAEAPSAASLRSRLGEVPIELRAVLGQASFTLDELSSLRVGDVIALDRAAHDPVDLVVQDRALFRARAGVAGQWVAIELIGPPHQEKIDHD